MDRYFYFRPDGKPVMCDLETANKVMKAAGDQETFEVLVAKVYETDTQLVIEEILWCDRERNVPPIQIAFDRWYLCSNTPAGVECVEWSIVDNDYSLARYLLGMFYEATTVFFDITS